MSTDETRPAADPGREQTARELFPFDMPVEEYAARNGHKWDCFSFHTVRYEDPRVDAWIQRLGDIFFKQNGAPSLDELRQEYLSAEEIRAIAQPARARRWWEFW